MHAQFAIPAAIALAASLPLAACRESEAEPTNPSRPAAAMPATARVKTASPREQAVLAAMEGYKQAILDRDTAELARTWTENYTFINPQGGLVTREERLANLGSGNTNVQVIDNEREITVRLFGDAAIVQNLSTLRGGGWKLVTNQLTPVSP